MAGVLTKHPQAGIPTVRLPRTGSTDIRLVELNYDWRLFIVCANAAANAFRSGFEPMTLRGVNTALRLRPLGHGGAVTCDG